MVIDTLGPVMGDENIHLPRQLSGESDDHCHIMVQTGTPNEMDHSQLASLLANDWWDRTLAGAHTSPASI